MWLFINVVWFLFSFALWLSKSLGLVLQPRTRPQLMAVLVAPCYWRKDLHPPGRHRFVLLWSVNSRINHVACLKYCCLLLLTQDNKLIFYFSVACLTNIVAYSLYNTSLHPWLSDHEIMFCFASVFLYRTEVPLCVLNFLLQMQE